MIATLKRTLIATALTFALAGTAVATNTAADVDLGAAPANQPTEITLTLALRNQAQLETFIHQTVTPTDPHYQQFLSTEQFAATYGATAAQVAQVQAYLTHQGLRSQVLANHMTVQVTGTLGQFEQVFGVSVHDFRSAQDGNVYQRPLNALTMPAALNGATAAVSGLNTDMRWRSHRLTQPNLPFQKVVPPHFHTLLAATRGDPTATGVPGQYTVGDVANQYDINPLYQQGINGKGSTIGIVTLSNFDPNDALTYWNDIGLKVKPNRITQIHVDGGGVIDSGSGETALDVEQSGGLAPQANVIVYDAPNAGSGYLDAFAKAVSDNKADSISTSWGSPEIYQFAALNVDGASNTDTSDAGDLQAFHQVFMEAAAQGQSIFAASGDSGAYDTVRGLGTGNTPGTYSHPLTVDAPASDPYMTAAGGTTLPFTYAFGSGPVESITHESVWGWDYIQNYFDTYLGQGLINLFSTGGGGGVSVYWSRPFYQSFTRGVKNSQPHQALVYNLVQGKDVLLKLPAHFRGRNVPDISLNADPETGYLVYSTVDGGLTAGNGGTSFVAPQLNGITALLTQSTGHRVGFFNPTVYLLQLVFNYGKYSPFNEINAGDNWFYRGKPKYNPGAGLGSIDVNRLDQFLKLGLRL